MKLKIIYLIGLMGVGKTYWGKLLSEHLNVYFVDLDKTLEEQLGYTVAEIFAKKGESYFRKIEANILRQQIKYGKLILSTGGGTPCFYNNIHWMNNTGKTIWLKDSIDNIYQRVINEKEKRPVISNIEDESLKKYLSELLKERTPYYNLSKFHLEANEINEQNLIKICKNY